MSVTEKIDNYLNESTVPPKLIKKALRYVEKKYPNPCYTIGWDNGTILYMFEICDGKVDNQDTKTSSYTKRIFNDVEEDKGLAKVLSAKKAYIKDL